MAMAGGTASDVSDPPIEKSKKRLSSVIFGWDHYRSHEDTIDFDDEYQSWRNKKRRRIIKRSSRKKVLSDTTDDSVTRSPALTAISEPESEDSELTKMTSSRSEISLLSATSRTMSDDSPSSPKEKSIIIHIREITHDLASTVV